MPFQRRYVCTQTIVLLGLALASTPAAKADTISDRIKRGYGEAITLIDAEKVVMRNGVSIAINDGRGEKSADQWLATPDLKDMFRFPYPANAPLDAPQTGTDPGRARNAAFFNAVYGDCTKGEVERNLVSIPWPSPADASKPTTLKVTKLNGVSDRLRAVSQEVSALPLALRPQLTPPAGGYVCRTIVGTTSPSAHGWGIAIDINTSVSDYWRWNPTKGSNAIPPYRNRIAPKIVAIFEKHGFIWGGRWSHFDTMHFEYRPELLPPAN